MSLAQTFIKKIFLGFIIFLMKLYPCNYLSRESGLYKASDVCEKSDAVKRLSMTIIYLTDELN